MLTMTKDTTDVRWKSEKLFPGALWSLSQERMVTSPRSAGVHGEEQRVSAKGHRVRVRAQGNTDEAEEPRVLAVESFLFWLS